jgi:1,4-alpha-glucan branching enzyme
MSKLLDLLAQQKALAEQIKLLESDEKEAKVLKFVEDLEALRNKHGYSVPDFLDVVHSLHRVKTPAKTAQSVSVKTTKAKAPKFKVMINGVETILQSKKAGAVGKTIEALGFTTYADYLNDLIKKNKVADFDALIKKLNGVPA